MHQNGITLGQPLGETIALVVAPDAKGVAVVGQTGVKTDFRGYAILPYATPYKKNDIMLDTQSFEDDTEVAITNQTVVPTRGAVVRAKYQTSVGYRVLMNLMKAGGTPVPFGAVVSDMNNKSGEGFIVGDSGQVYLTGLDPKGRLKVQWGSDSGEQCFVDYIIPESKSSLINMNQQCK